MALQSQINQLATQLTDEQTLNVNLAAQLDDSMRFEEVIILFDFRSHLLS